MCMSSGFQSTEVPKALYIPLVVHICKAKSTQAVPSQVPFGQAPQGAVKHIWNAPSFWHLLCQGPSWRTWGIADVDVWIMGKENPTKFELQSFPTMSVSLSTVQKVMEGLDESVVKAAFELFSKTRAVRSSESGVAGLTKQKYSNASVFPATTPQALVDNHKNALQGFPGRRRVCDPSRTYWLWGFAGPWIHVWVQGHFGFVGACRGNWCSDIWEKVWTRLEGAHAVQWVFHANPRGP